MSVDYDFTANLHTLEGPHAAMEHIVAEFNPSSLLDVGCGNGTWLKAAMDHGVQQVAGVDGCELNDRELHVPSAFLRTWDLTTPFDLGKRFDLALCLEVAEHLEERAAGVLVDSLVRHADSILFSAACPGQMGQHHVNCQWPEYWQRLFNERGYACSDEIRWAIWGDDRIEAWYRQNMFLAQRSPSRAGTEKRIAGVVHPAICQNMTAVAYAACMHQIESGSMRVGWYFGNSANAFASRVVNLFSRTYARVFSRGGEQQNHLTKAV